MRQISAGFLRLGVLSLAALIASTALAQVTKNPPSQPSANSANDQSNVDIAYGAFQRGLYITAFNEATKRAQQNDAAAMTLLGEMYAQGLGVGRDDAKAAQWYKAAAERRDFSKPPRGSATRERLTTWACSISRVSSSRRISGAPANYSPQPQKPVIPKRSMRLRPCTRRAAGYRRI